MSDGSQTEVSTDSNIKQTALGGIEFSGSIDSKDPMAAKTTPAPEGVPDKFWDPIAGKLRTDDLIKSYSELEKQFRSGKKGDEEEAEETEEVAEETTEEETEGTEEAPEETTEEETEETEKANPEEDFKAAIEAAQTTYAETGELPEEARKPFLDMGFTGQQIDLYLAGVKATEAALQTTAYKAAGSPEAYSAAIKGAGEGGLTPKQIQAFNAQVGDVETVGPAVAGLMASFKAANPGEGQLTNINSGVNRGDVYESMAEFQQDLAAADKVRDGVARKKAVDKLRRSREAGTIKHSNRRQPFGGK
jgi:hypothetical protein